MSPACSILRDMEKMLPGLSRYRFRDDGEVVSLWRQAPRVLRGGTDKDGYRKFVLIDDIGRRRYVRRASLICAAFAGPRPQGAVIRHLDGSRTNDTPGNLTWGTQAENIADKARHGTLLKGAQHPRAKLSEEQARTILKESGTPLSQLARRFGVSKAAVYFVRTRRTWKWLVA